MSQPNHTIWSNDKDLGLVGLDEVSGISIVPLIKDEEIQRAMVVLMRVRYC